MLECVFGPYCVLNADFSPIIRAGIFSANRTTVGHCWSVMFWCLLANGGRTTLRLTGELSPQPMQSHVRLLDTPSFLLMLFLC